MKKRLAVLNLFLLIFISALPDIKAGDIPGDDMIWDLAELSKPPKTNWVDKTGPVQSFLYKSVSFEGRPTEVFAYYSNPDMLVGRPASGRKYPALVLVHGGGGTAFKEWVEKWAAEGYAAIAMDLSGRNGKGEPLKNPGPGQGTEDKFTKIENSPLQDVWTYHAVASVVLAHSWLLSQPEVDTAKTGITGISWGGYLTCIAGAIDHRFKAAVPVYGCAYYDEADTFKTDLSKLTEAGRRLWMKYFDPSVYLPGAKARFLFLNGNKDKHYNVVPYHKTYSLLEPAQRKVIIIPDMKHSHYHGWEPHEIKYFFDQVLENKAPLPDLANPIKSANELTITYSSPVSLSSAEFYYSLDSTSTNEARKWQVQKAIVDPVNNRITTPWPPNGFKYGFFFVRDNRNISASSEFIIHE